MSETNLIVPNTLEEQKKLFAFNYNIQNYNEFNTSFALNWSEENPTIQLHTNYGFIPAVMFQLLQAITQQNICICSGCSNAYVRTGRKPKRGMNNYCDSCRGSDDYRHYRAAKAIYHRKKK